MTRQDREAAVASEIDRLREYAKSGAYLPLGVRYEHLAFAIACAALVLFLVVGVPA